MKLNQTFLVIASLLAINFSKSQTFIQSYQNVVNQVSQTNITNNLTSFESFGIKRRGTTAQANTLTWLKNNYTNFGYTTSQIVESPFTYVGSSAICKNLIVTKTGTTFPNIFVIICAHYDTINGSGTNDNGSGTACLLEVARLLKNIPTQYSIKFIHFSGEEDGLYGSKHYVSKVVNSTNPKMNIRLVFNIDEVGGVKGLVNNTITCDVDQDNFPSTNNVASSNFTNQLAKCVALYTSLKTKFGPAEASDYIPFENNGEVITGFYESNISTKPHTSGDVLANMDPVYNFNVAKAAVGAMLHFTTANTATAARESYISESQVNVYPNPTKNELFIDKGDLEVHEFSISIFDIYGKTVYQKEISSADLVTPIDVSNFTSGIYMCKINAGEKEILKKLVIE